MTQSVINLISTRQAEATSNGWLICYVGDRFLAGTPQLDSVSETWRIPILYVYPRRGALGSVGEMTIDATTGEISDCPAVEHLKRQARALYESHLNPG